ncbi:hypothetical protein HAX54_000455, partial [Datura stramonium]|nr:hypothetical protein [Datura stramonium]
MHEFMLRLVTTNRTFIVLVVVPTVMVNYSKCGGAKIPTYESWNESWYLDMIIPHTHRYP